MENNLMDKIVSLCKRRGFIFPGSEIYGGLQGFWDYGPLGTELKKNVKNAWWKTMVQQREDVVGIDAAIIMNPDVWKASGHVESFTDPLIECKNCHHRFRMDHLFAQTPGTYFEDKNNGVIGKVQRFDEFGQHQDEANKLDLVICPDCQRKGKWTQPKLFNLLTEVYLGITEPKQKAFLRGEITQGVFVNFQNVVSSSRVKIPFGIAQIGKAFRNEITPGNFIFRSREFEQMELEYFVKPEETVAKETFDYFKKLRLQWYIDLGINKDRLRFREHAPDERAHYAQIAEDIEYSSPFGWKEFEGIHHRGDWDLSRHKLAYTDPDTGKKFIPWVIETSAGADRATLFFLIDAYTETEKRVILKLHPKLSPVKVAIFPLVANKEELVKKARVVYLQLKKTDLAVAWDDRGNIGKRYLSQDEIGTPWCVTIDYDTLKDDTVTVRDRNTTEQIRIHTDKLATYLQNLLQQGGTSI